MPTITIDNIHDMRPMPSIARMARLLSGSMWRPRDWNTETPQTVADDAVAFLRCAGLVSFTRNKAAIRRVIVSDVPPRQSDHRKAPRENMGYVYAPINLILRGRTAHLHDMESDSLDGALDLIAGWMLLHGSSRPSFYGCSFTERKWFGATIPDYEDTPSEEQTVAAHRIAYADFATRSGASPVQVRMAKAARRFLAHQYADEIICGRTRSLDCALRCALIARAIRDNEELEWIGAQIGNSIAPQGDRLRGYLLTAARLDNGLEAFALFGREEWDSHPEKQATAQNDRESNIPTDESEAEHEAARRDYCENQSDQRRVDAVRRGKDAHIDSMGESVENNAADESEIAQSAARSITAAREEKEEGQSKPESGGTGHLKNIHSDWPTDLERN